MMSALQVFLDIGDYVNGASYNYMKWWNNDDFVYQHIAHPFNWRHENKNI